MSFIMVWKVAGLLVRLKKHDQRFKESTISTESGLPLISLFHLDIIEAPSYVQLGEIFCTPEFLYQLRGEWKGVLVFHHDCIEGLVILDKLEGFVLLLDKNTGEAMGDLDSQMASPELVPLQQLQWEKALY